MSSKQFILKIVLNYKEENYWLDKILTSCSRVSFSLGISSLVYFKMSIPLSGGSTICFERLIHLAITLSWFSFCKANPNTVLFVLSAPSLNTHRDEFD